jgi:exopolysaccharide biosynthesis WecB/TagA/CpsF family protein
MSIENSEICATTDFLDIRFATVPFKPAVELILALARGERMSIIVTPNVDHVNRLSKRGTPALNHAYDAATLRFCDSRILAGIARLFGTTLPIVPGSDLIAMLVIRGFGDAQKIAIVGGDQDTIAGLKNKLPLPEFVQHIPPMGIMAQPAALDAVVDFVCQSRADFTLFAIGCPQSEILAARCAERAEARGVAMCVGASIDFILGKQNRAPRWMRKRGLEWAHRLLSEPGRMWRRYLVQGPQIFIIAAKYYARNRRKMNPQNG